jgi:hypothetical protein
VLNTSRQVGASVALAALATIAADRTQSLLGAGRHVVTHNAVTHNAVTHEAVALTAGFSRGFTVAALIALAGVVAGVFIPRPRPSPARADGAQGAAAEQVVLAAKPEG